MRDTNHFFHLCAAMCVALIVAAPTAALSISFDRVTATLAPVPTSATENFFQPATLTLNNATTHTIRAVLLKPTGGGPAIYWPCVVPANTQQIIKIPLPPFSASQPYAVYLLAEDSPHAAPLAAVDATIDWPIELVRREFLQANYEPARWPDDVKRNTALLLAMGLLAMASTLLIRKPAWRTAAALAVASGATVVIVVVLYSQPNVHEQRLPAGRVPGAGGETIAVSALRSTLWSADRPLVPAYQTMAEFRADESIVHPGRAITTPLRAGQTRLFTPAKIDDN